jgi:hypothetical protein
MRVPGPDFDHSQQKEKSVELCSTHSAVSVKSQIIDYRDFAGARRRPIFNRGILFPLVSHTHICYVIELPPTTPADNVQMSGLHPLRHKLVSQTDFCLPVYQDSSVKSGAHIKLGEKYLFASDCIPLTFHSKYYIQPSAPAALPVNISINLHVTLCGVYIYLCLLLLTLLPFSLVHSPFRSLPSTPLAHALSLRFPHSTHCPSDPFSGCATSGGALRAPAAHDGCGGQHCRAEHVRCGTTLPS